MIKEMVNAMMIKMIKKNEKYFKDFQCVAGSILHNTIRHFFFQMLSFMVKPLSKAVAKPFCRTYRGLLQGFIFYMAYSANFAKSFSLSASTSALVAFGFLALGSNS